MLPRELEEKIEYVYQAIKKANMTSNINSNSINSVFETLVATIPTSILEMGVFSFVRSSTENNQPSIEISILTKDYIIHNLVCQNERNLYEYFQLSPTTLISLATYYQTAEDNSSYSDTPYRAELGFHEGRAKLIYSAEGDRRVVKSLINYAQKCLTAIHELKDGEK